MIRREWESDLFDGFRGSFAGHQAVGPSLGARRNDPVAVTLNAANLHPRRLKQRRCSLEAFRGRDRTITNTVRCLRIVRTLVERAASRRCEVLESLQIDDRLQPRD